MNLIISNLQTPLNLAAAEAKFFLSAFAKDIKERHNSFFQMWRPRDKSVGTNKSAGE